MVKKIEIDHDGGWFSAQKAGENVMMSFKDSPMTSLADLKKKNRLFDYLDALTETDQIKVLILLVAAGQADREEYNCFYKRVFDEGSDLGDCLRMFNAFNQLILRLVELNKAVLHAGGGRTTMMFFNLSLACDYRIISDDTVFQNPCLDFGLAPKGGGAYFLSRLLGPAKAFELLLSCHDVKAEEAMALGLVNRIVPADQLTEAALEEAERICRSPLSSIAGVKKMVNFSIRDLREFLELENQELARLIHSGRLRGRLKN